ncbi:unnamed protein product [Penicillium salamii]|uniref:Transmembrane protein n=1 Tax=Penicillium salamii TaxID=1612424 RepID=A0A9W4NZG8_9EURO|nr:unnamed protein product [Penicillium salamii]CAG7977550.1 unnamed protein product [Penicillium salamii]CAG8195022.1 unnamed protein product [Penicillium salamii]CAG8210993.1 unnamed protein product [Penicillium salamii]CAG8213694.1 unnamed protein product [Penicillium salamii]
MSTSNPFTIADLGIQNMRDDAIIATISIFGISYFSLFGLQFLLFHFPSSPAIILNSLSLIFFSRATIPSVVLLFSTLPSVQLGYLFSFTLVAVGNLVDFLAWDLSSSVARLRFPYYCTSLCLFSLVLIIHALTGTLSSISPLAVQFGQLCVFGGWRLELYVMHSILAYSVVIYSQAVLCAVLESAQ